MQAGKSMAIDELKDKFAELSLTLQGVKSVILLCHDNPDPDALASMLALRYLLSRHFHIRSTLTYGGEIGRAENKAMARVLAIPVHSLESLRLHKRANFALVDTQPAARNHSLPEGAKVLLVFDHHPPKKPLRGVFNHICPELGATSTLMFEYLREAKLEIDWHMATALAYALISETQDLGREARREDIQAYQKLIPKARLRILSSIKYPILEHDYFQTLSRALNQTYYYKNIVVTRLGRVNSTDMIHQMADLFLRFERRSWSLCIGWNSDFILLSMRSANTRARCGRMIQKLVKGKGSAGGHDMVAGGKVNCQGLAEKEKVRIEELLITRFLSALGHERNLQLLVPIIDQKPPYGSPS